MKWALRSYVHDDQVDERFLMKWALRSYVHDDQVDERNDDDDDDHDDDGDDDDDDEVDATLWLSDGACMRVRVNLHMNQVLRGGCRLGHTFTLM